LILETPALKSFQPKLSKIFLLIRKNTEAKPIEKTNAYNVPSHDPF
jgi:hypothetical protein